MIAAVPMRYLAIINTYLSTRLAQYKVVDSASVVYSDYFGQYVTHVHLRDGRQFHVAPRFANYRVCILGVAAKVKNTEVQSAGDLLEFLLSMEAVV